MRITKVYELQDAIGTVIDVGYTCRPEKRMYQHTKTKPGKGTGKYYGRTDLKMVIVSEHFTRKEAAQAEIALKSQHGLEPIEHLNGVRNGKLNRKLTMEQAEEIRAKYVPWKYTLDKLAKEYGINSATVHGIIHYHYYKS